MLSVIPQGLSPKDKERRKEMLNDSSVVGNITSLQE
jgi:hypothetical protein